MNQFDTFTLVEDLNPIIKKGMKGTILEIYNSEMIEVEFVDEYGKNFEFEGNGTFTINKNKIQLD